MTQSRQRYTPDNLVHGVEYERVPPHDDGDGVVAHGQTVCCNEQALRLREDPDTEDHEDVDKVAQVSEEVVVAFLVVGDEADGHEVEQLARVPVGEEVWVQSDQVARDKDVHDSSDEGRLLLGCHRDRVLPLLVQAVHRVAHAPSILVELLALVWHSSTPFLDDAVSGDASVLCLVLDLLRLRRYGGLELLDALGQGEVLDKVEHGQPLDRREEGGLFIVRVVMVGAVGEGSGAREAGRGEGRLVGSARVIKNGGADVAG